MPGSRASVREARFVMSNIYLDQKRFNEAQEHLELVLDEFPQDEGALNDLGFLLVDQGKSLQRATKMIRFAVDAEPDNVAYRDSLGWALYRAGKFKEAVAELQKAASDETPDPIILDHLGDALRSTGNEKSAVSTWQRALSLIQDDASSNGLKQTITQKLEQRLAESR
jgi:tetratricopeptide (TPR) repeat protein